MRVMDLTIDKGDEKSSDVLLEDVSFRYTRQDDYVLQKLDASVARGSFAALVGRSGCGKTTLLNLICGYLQPTGGRCLVGGEAVWGPGSDRIPIFQEDALWPWLSALENVMLHNRLAFRKNAAATHPSGGESKAAELLNRMDFPGDALRKHPKELSLGMRKRVEFARALFGQPRLIIADEPFANVDVHTRSVLYELVRGILLERRTTLLFSTHDLHEALSFGSEILVMRSTLPSRVVFRMHNPFFGDRVALRQRGSEYYAAYESLFAAMQVSQ
jgi:ABC-type nitrate/sulfonate/bicarbonate transport system ATPase subunit